jgi:hypothetical protein
VAITVRDELETIWKEEVMAKFQGIVPAFAWRSAEKRKTNE